jgi:hypothetical protein
MTALSSVAADHADEPRLTAVVASRPLWLALAVTALVTALRLTGTVDSDVAWQLWIAGRIHAGATLYRDIIETNPPLWFWMALPVDRAASLLQVRVESVLIVSIGALVALSLAATDRLIRHIGPGRRASLLAYAALMLTAMPWMHVGQREQIVLIGTIPYAALIAARRNGKPVPALLAVLIGLGAALGFALKHYFLVVPITLELWLLVGAGRRWRPWRPEAAAIVAVGLIYAAALLIWARDFLTVVLPLLRLAYGATGAPSFRHLFPPAMILSLLVLALIGAHARQVSSSRTPFTTALLVCAAGFAGAYLLQSKGWPYHAIPLLGCASLALAALLAEAVAFSPALRILAPTLLLLPLAAAARDASDESMPSPDLLRAVSGLRPGDSVGFLTEDTALPWSVTLQHRFRYPSRYNGFWMLRAIVANEASSSPDPRLESLGLQIVSQTTTDFRCLPPRRIIVARPQPGTWSADMVDILPFFTRDPQFADLLAHYRPIGRTSLDVYELKLPLDRLPASQCRRGI